MLTIKKKNLIKLIKEFKSNPDFIVGSGNKSLTDFFNQEDFKEKSQIRLWCWKLYSPKENKAFYEYVGEKSVMENCIEGDTLMTHLGPRRQYEKSGGLAFHGDYGPKNKRKIDDPLSTNYNVMVSDQNMIRQLLCSDDVGSIIVHDHSSDFKSGEIHVGSRSRRGDDFPFLEVFYTPVPDVITIKC